MNDVLVLTSSGCHLCEDAREGLAEIVGTHPFRVREVDMASSEGAALVERYRPSIPPAVIIDGQLFSSGRLPRRKLRKLLEKGVI
jgi:hypothetical protein